MCSPYTLVLALDQADIWLMCCTSSLYICLQVIKSIVTDQAELELFPRYLLFLRQQPATRTPQSNIWVNMGMTSLRMFPPHFPRGNVSLQQERGSLHRPGQPNLLKHTQR